MDYEKNINLCMFVQCNRQIDLHICSGMTVLSEF